MRSIVTHAPWSGFPPRDDPEGWLAFLFAWHDRFGDRLVAADELVHAFNLASKDFDALAYTPRRCRVILNRLLWKASGRVYEPFTIEPFTPAENGSSAFRLRKLVPLTYEEARHRG